MRVCEFACHWCLPVCHLCAYVLGVMYVHVCECINMHLCVQYWSMEVHKIAPIASTSRHLTWFVYLFITSSPL